MPPSAARESPDDLTPYETAFARITDDPQQHLMVAEPADAPGRVVGTLQLSVIHGLSRQGASRALIEAGGTSRPKAGGGRTPRSAAAGSAAR